MPITLLPQEVDDYQLGRETARQNRYAPTDSSPWWQREGWNQEVHNRSSGLYPPLALAVASPIPYFVPLTPVVAGDVAAYRAGFNLQPGGSGFWYRLGTVDRTEGRAIVALAQDLPPPPSIFTGAAPTPTPMPTPPALRLAYPTVELLATEGGRKVPYDQAKIDLDGASLPGPLAWLAQFGFVLKPQVRFQFVGDGPDGRRDGYGLAGPTGPIAQLVLRANQIYVTSGGKDGLASLDPQSYRLPAWVGTHWRSGRVKLLGAPELQEIGMLDPLIQRFAAF